MEGLRKLKKIIFHSILTLMLFNTFMLTYASWYEEPLPMKKQEEIDDMWWLSKKKREKLKIEQEEEFKNIYS